MLRASIHWRDLRCQLERADCRRDIITILPTGADEGTRGNHIRIGEEKAMDIIMAEDPGLDEIRFLDVSNRAILG